jgi:predicted site-specific integrase-resolvase
VSRQIDIQKILAHDFAAKAEAALDLQVAERTLDRWLAKGDGPPATLIGKRRFFEWRALAEFKKQRKAKVRS